ncbi:MAG TPA: hypothetical protein VKP78_09490 [bacterium]|nr:hypothetical protein [bacterium]
MKIKNYIGLSFKDAVKNAKAELGEEIAILESKKVDSDNNLPGSKKLIQISVVDDSGNGSTQVDPAQFNHGNNTKDDQHNASMGRSSSNKKYRFSDDEKQFLYQEMAKLNKYINKFHMPNYPENYIDIFNRLREVGVGETQSKQMIKRAYQRLESTDHTGKAPIVREIRRQVFSLLRPFHIPRNQTENPQSIALVGPSGSGKTTTIMKLATHPDFFGKDQRKIISSGNFGVGTASTLKKYAKLTGIDVELSKKAREIKRIIKKNSGQDILLFDTPSLSSSKSGNIQKFYKNLKQIDNLITLLVLDAPRDPGDVEYIFEKYRFLNPDAVIITKLDETRKTGKLISIIKKINLPVMAISQGKSIPDHLRKDYKEIVWKQIESGIKGAN